MAQRHMSLQESSATVGPNAIDSRATRVHYMILSVRHIMLCHANGPNSLLYTAPEPLFNGDYDIGPPSDLALDDLTWATTSARPVIYTTLRSLPVEVQEIILGYAYIGTVEAAQIGCLVGLGLPFSWKDSLLKVVLEERYLIRPSGSPVESEVWFGENKSGIVYLARAN